MNINLRQWLTKKGKYHSLFCFRPYLDEIDKLSAKNAESSHAGLYGKKLDSAIFQSLTFKRKHLAKLLAKAVRNKAYRFQPAHIVPMLFEGKERKIYTLHTMDRIVCGALSHLIYKHPAAHVHPAVYSYQKGVNNLQAIHNFAHYIERYKRNVPDIRQRGLYVIRCDVKSYGENIPVHPQSELWPRLYQMVSEVMGVETVPPYLWELYQSMVRPEIYTDEGYVYQNMIGIPDGAPIVSLLLNVYLSPLDHALSAIPGGFYARYSDDFLFAHPDPDVAQRTDVLITEMLAQLGLKRNAEKNELLYFNGAGRKSGQVPEARGISSVTYLGYTVGFGNSISIKTRRYRELLQEIKQKARQMRKHTLHMPWDKSGRMVCTTINQTLDCYGILHNIQAQRLLKTVNNHQQLKHLDYLIARTVLKVMTGSSSAKSFRFLPYRKMRQDWKLTSLAYMRNINH